jgi:hypothetical protein
MDMVQSDLHRCYICYGVILDTLRQKCWTDCNKKLFTNVAFSKMLHTKRKMIHAEKILEANVTYYEKNIIYEQFLYQDLTRLL